MEQTSLNPELLKMLDNQFPPGGRILKDIKEIYTYYSRVDPIASLIYVFNYGVITGKRSERDLKKHNRTADVLNTYAFVKENNRCPKGPEEVYEWVRKEEKR